MGAGPGSSARPEPTALVANLPYNVSVPVLLHLMALLQRFGAEGRTVLVVDHHLSDHELPPATAHPWALGPAALGRKT